MDHIRAGALGGEKAEGQGMSLTRKYREDCEDWALDIVNGRPNAATVNPQKKQTKATEFFPEPRSSAASKFL